MEKGPYHKIFNRSKKGKREFGNIYTKMEYYWINLNLLYYNEYFHYHVVILAVSFLVLIIPYMGNSEDQAI